MTEWRHIYLVLVSLYCADQHTWFKIKLHRTYVLLPIEWRKEIIASFHTRDMRTPYCPCFFHLICPVITKAVLAFPIKYVSKWLHVPTNEPTSAMWKNRKARRTAWQYERKRNVFKCAVRTESSNKINVNFGYLHRTIVRRSVVGLSPLKPRFEPRSVVRFVVNRVALGHFFVPSTSVSPCQCRSTKATYVYMSHLPDGQKGEN
jgi:hypothetical protein